MLTFLHSQQRSYTCAVAAIRTVLHRQFGVRIAEAALVALGRTPEDSIVDAGSDTHSMRRMVRAASKGFNEGPPWTLRVRKHGTYRQLSYWLKHGRWPIVQVYVPSHDLHHTVVVLEVTDTRVCYFDPDPSDGREPRWMSRDQFLEWWISPISGETWWSVINGGNLVKYE